MPATQRRVYFDANVFLAYVGNEEGRSDTVQDLLQEARRSELEIVTSVLSIAEVAYGAHERDHGLNDDSEEVIEQLWTPASPVTLIDVSKAVTRKARTIIREAKRQGFNGFRGADAIHLATAQMFGCDEIFTYEAESSRARWQQIIGIAVTEPVTNTPTLGL